MTSIAGVMRVFSGHTGAQLMETSDGQCSRAD